MFTPTDRQSFVATRHSYSALATGLLCMGFLVGAAGLWAEETAAPENGQPEGKRLFVKEYRVRGGKAISPLEIEKAVYPYLGPGRTPADVDAAREALEKAFHEKGFQTVSVQIPEQQVRKGVVLLDVTEAPVGRLRVKGSRFYDLEKIKSRARSLAEGRVVNFNEVSSDITALNQWSDRKITPSLAAGVEPDTVDVELRVEDKLPLHASLELNNRQSVDTVPMRLNASVSYTNLWQLGHTLGLGYQTAPEDQEDSLVYSAYYIARFPALESFSLMIQGTKQDSNVSTLGGAAVAGKGDTLGIRGIVTLPPRKDFFHSINFGIDYKDYNQDVLFGGETTYTPVTYYPISVGYGATWVGKKYVSDLNLNVVFALRGVGSDVYEFDNNRYNADGSFIYLRGDTSHTFTLPADFQVFAKIQGQASPYPLISNEQFAGGGASTVRGYLEAEALGDSAIGVTLELRSPSLLWWLKSEQNQWRIHGFLDAEYLSLNDTLPEQDDRFDLASAGVGSSLTLFDHISGSIDFAHTLTDSSTTPKGKTRLIFQVSGEF